MRKRNQHTVPHGMGRPRAVPVASMPRPFTRASRRPSTRGVESPATSARSSSCTAATAASESEIRTGMIRSRSRADHGREHGGRLMPRTYSMGRGTCEV